MHENNLLTTDTEKAEGLNHFFWKCFNRSDSSSIHFSAEKTCVSSEDSSILEVTEETPAPTHVTTILSFKHAYAEQTLLCPHLSLILFLYGIHFLQMLLVLHN